MNKKFWLTIIILAAIVNAVIAQTQTLSLTGTVSDNSVLYSGHETWVTGSVTVSRTSTATNPWFTVDLAPNADQTGGTYPRNANWTYYSNTGQSSSIYIDAVEIFTSKSTSGNIIKQWDANGIGDANVTSNNVFSYQFVGTNLTRTFSFYGVFWDNNTLAAGFYELPVTFRLRQEQFNASGPTTDTISSVTLILRFVVTPTAIIFFKSGTSEITSLDFDEVTTTTSKSFTISVQSSFRFDISVESALGHGGYLWHEKRSDPLYPITETIPYTLKIDNVTIPLTAGAYTFKKKQSSTNFSSTFNNSTAVITIGDISEYAAGKYTDSLSFTVTAD